MSDFKKRLTDTINRAEVFHPVNEDFKHISHHIKTFKPREMGLNVKVDDIIVYEKEIFWEDQEIWFSNSKLLENYRMKFLQAGIDVSDSDNELFLLMKVPK